jgi:hypothetical protein
MNSEYVVSLEKQNEELRQKLASLETQYVNNFQLRIVVTDFNYLINAKQLSKWKPTVSIDIYAMIRICAGTEIVGNQVIIQHLITAVKKLKKWDVRHGNNVINYHIKTKDNDTNDVIKYILKKSGYENFEYMLV